MRIFSGFDDVAATSSSPATRENSNAKRNGPPKRKKVGRAPKENLSAAEIRQRVKDGLNKKNSDKVDVKKNNRISSTMSGDKFNEVDEKLSTKEAEELAEDVVGDVGVNNPEDPATRGKLKDILNTGAFSFNEKEREALSSILADDP